MKIEQSKEFQEAYSKTFEGQMNIIRTELDKIRQVFLKDAKRIFSLIRRRKR